jgi:outer membrane protein insertion porin family
MKKKYLPLKNICLIILSLLIISGCSNTRYLAEGQELFTGAKVEIKSEEEIQNKKSLTSELQNIIRPKPNASFLGLKIRLWIYNIAGEPVKEKGLRVWVRNKLGEVPVLLSDVNPSSVSRLMVNRLENRGHFFTEVTFEVQREKRRKVQVHYLAETGRAYTYKNISFPEETSVLTKAIVQTKAGTLLKAGEPYDLNVLMNERERIDSLLKNIGFFFFSPDYILFRVDSMVGERQVNISVQVKPDIPSNAKRKYTMGTILMDTHFSIDREVDLEAVFDTLNLNGLQIIDRENTYDPKVLERSVFLKNGEVYSRARHQITLNHLMGLGIFKFANIRFVEENTGPESGVLNAYIQLTPLHKKSLRLELRAVSKSNNFAGPGLNASFRNRNAFRGAELFILNFKSGYETQISGTHRGVNSIELGATAEVQIPRYIIPFYDPIGDRPVRYIPRTRVLFGFQVLKRVQFFNLNSFNASYGYLWSESIDKKHELNVIQLNYVSLGRTSEEFERILERNPILRRSFEQQLIIGSHYNYTINDQLKEQRIHNNFFNFNIDVAGNSVHLVQNIVKEEPATEERPHSIAGVAYSQFSRVDVDYRHYYRPSPKTRLVGRFMAGVGAPYGNSRTLPYVKQFFSGGTNSIRAFQARSIGPGTYRNPEVRDRGFFFDQTGDIKLEANLEHRFDMISILKGAFFIDAGNIWTIRENPDVPGGNFQWDEFYNEIAVGAGTGIRIDASFFVLRLDLAMPLRKPFLQPDERWAINQINFGDPAWRSQNLVLNIAIGYPF